MLFTGIMPTPSGPKALEYNARFGDPETQTLLPLLHSDLAEVMLACLEGRLHSFDVVMRPFSCATVVLSADGYPGEYRIGQEIKIGNTGKEISPRMLSLERPLQSSTS